MHCADKETEKDSANDFWGFAAILVICCKLAQMRSRKAKNCLVQKEHCSLQMWKPHLQTISLQFEVSGQTFVLVAAFAGAPQLPMVIQRFCTEYDEIL